MKTRNLFLFSILILLFASSTTLAQNDEGFIYGKITTVDDNEYQGEIRWDDEETFWFDMFNSTKPENEYLIYLSDRELDDLQDRNSSWFENWDFLEINISKEDFSHVFACQFGDIKKLKITGSNSVLLYFKNGDKIELKGGSNDMGASVLVLDESLGELELDWDRIDEVVFMPTPSKLESKLGDALFGTVTTERNEKFTGYIQWDHDERISTQELDGEIRDGDISVAFGKIKSIEKYSSGSLVTLNSGKEYYMKGTNDVNSGNRGIIVNIPGMGRVDIDWDEFEKVEFQQDHKRSGPAFDDFVVAPLKGSVLLENEQKVSGKIVFDLDEALDCEVLQGEYNDIEYLIPFRNIKKIQVKNYKYSKITLRNGEELLLGEAHDVSYDNYGVIVFPSEDEFGYIPYHEVEEIVFK